MKYLKGLYDLKRIVSGYEIIKSFERYNAVRTRFTFDFFLKGRYGSNHIVLSPHPGFWKSGECRILKDVMVQLGTIWFTVFNWTLRFNRTIRVGTTQHLSGKIYISDSVFHWLNFLYFLYYLDSSLCLCICFCVTSKLASKHEKLQK